MAYYTAGIIGSFVRSAITPAGFDISGSTVRATNLLTSGTIRDTAGTLDISGGNIYISGTLTQGGGGGSSNLIVPGYIRNALTATEFDISGGNISNSRVHTTTGLVGTYLRNALTPSTYDISGGNISNSGTTRSTNIITSGYIRNALTPSTYDISGGNISNSGTTRSGTLLTPTTASNMVGGIVMSNGMIRADASDTFMVAAGSGTTNTLAYSSNGITWTGAGSSIFTTRGNAVAWNGVRWVAAGEGTNSLAYSSNGINWTGVGTAPLTAGGYGVAWDGSIWVAVGQGTHTIAWSPDGITWTGLGATVFTTGGYGVAWNGSIWVAVGEGTNSIAYSLNGTSWVGLGATVFAAAYGVAWNGELWVAVGQGFETIASSPDGINWTPASGGFDLGSGSGYGVAWNGEMWVAVGSRSSTGGSDIFYSFDGASWNSIGSNLFDMDAYGVAWNGSVWVAGGFGANTLAYSSDGATWTLGSSVIGNSTRGVAGRRYVLPLTSPIVFDASGGNIRFSGNIVNANTASSNRIGGVILSNGNISVSNVFAAGYIRNALTPTTFDISGGNISNSGTTRSANAIVSGYLRNALTATQFDISGGNISNSGRILNGAGTVFAPSYTFGNDASMGLYDPATNVLGFVTAGIDRMRIDASGNVGINTRATGTSVDSSTNGTLHVRAFPGVGETDAILTLQNSSPSFARGQAQIRATHAGTLGAGNALTFSTRQDSGSDFVPSNLIFERMRIAPNGNVGIGTVAPAAALDVSTGSVVSTIIRGNDLCTNTLRLQTNGIKVGQTNRIDFCSLDSGSSIDIARVSGIDVAIGAEAYRGNLTFSTRLGVDQVERMRITHQGIGFGTAAPAFGLDVSSTNATAVAILRNPTGEASMLVTGGGSNDLSGIKLYHRSTDQGIFILNRNPFHVWTSATRRFTIDLSGNHGMNTLTPAYAVDAVATIASNATINMSTWPRTPISNTLVRRFVSTRVGNTLNLSNTGTTLDPNLVTWDYSNASTGSSFRILKSGIWNITAQLCTNAGGAFGWIDASTNNISNVAIETAGSPWIAFGGNNSGAIFNITFVGYIPSNSSMFYKIRSTADLQTTAARASSYLHMTFLQEMPDAVAGFPNF